MGCSCNGSTRCRVNCFECEECSGAPSAPWATSLIVELPVSSSYALLLSDFLNSCGSYDECVTSCASNRTTAEASCDTTRATCNSDCAGDRATCEAACGDQACLDACAATEVTCIDSCSSDWRTCRSSADTTAIGCENTCWTGSSSALKICGSTTDGHATCCSDGDPDTFSGCLSTADVDYYEEIWPAVDTWHASVKSAWETHSACYWGCGDDTVCQDACTNPLWTSLAAAQSILYGLEENAARNRNDDRAACIYTYLDTGEIVDDIQITPRQAPCEGRYLASLKGYDLDADADWFGCAEALYACAQSCDYNEFVEEADEDFTCHGACNSAAILCRINSNRERMTSRMGECSTRYAGTHQQLRAKCLSTCEYTDDLCLLCEQSRESCIISCCAREGVDQEDCEFDCELKYNDCSLGSPCTTAMETCLQGCPNDDLGCMNTCIDTFYSCVSADVDASVNPPALSCGEYTPCVNLCNAELFSDCPSCEDDATGTSDDLLCLPSASFAYRMTPPVGREGICD